MCELVGAEPLCPAVYRFCCGVTLCSRSLSVFLGILAQICPHIFHLCRIFHHSLLGVAEHIVAVVRHGLAQGAHLILGCSGDLRGEAL